MARVAFFAHSEWRQFMLAVARKMKERTRSELHLYVISEQERKYYENHGAKQLFASITNVRDHLDVVQECVDDPDAVFALARDFEARIGTTYNMFSVAHRHFGRGFSLGGYGHPRSRYSEQSTYPQIINSYNKTMQFWEKELTEKRITLMMNGWKEAPVAARMLGIPTRGLLSSRYKNFHYWTYNEYCETPLVEEAYAVIGHAPIRKITAPYDTHLQYMVDYLGTLKLRSVLYRMKSKSYYMSEEVRFHWRNWRQNRHMTGAHMPHLSDLEGKRFVFFPLAAEPESTLQVISPEYFFQLGAIASIARDLPAGYYLVVKDTFRNFGRRPRDFYGQIRDFKNVILLDMLDFGHEIIQKADAVITIAGTAGFEAAIMGKPVITFGRHNLYNILPHVTLVTREEELAPALNTILVVGTDQAKAVNDGARLVLYDGARFLQAVIDTSFDMASYDITKPESVPRDILENAYAQLVRSVAGPARQTVASEGAA